MQTSMAKDWSKGDNLAGAQHRGTDGGNAGYGRLHEQRCNNNNNNNNNRHHHHHLKEIIL